MHFYIYFCFFLLGNVTGIQKEKLIATIKTVQNSIEKTRKDIVASPKSANNQVTIQILKYLNIFFVFHLCENKKQFSRNTSNNYSTILEYCFI